MNAIEGIEKGDVDFNNPGSILTVNASKNVEDKVKSAVGKVLEELNIPAERIN